MQETVKKCRFPYALKSITIAVLAVGYTLSPFCQCIAEETVPNDQIARIRIEMKEKPLFGKPQPNVYITHVDQKPLGGAWSGGLKNEAIDLKPGDRSIGLTWFAPYQHVGAIGVLGSVIINTVETDRLSREGYRKSGYGKDLDLQANAGHKYIARCYEKRLPLRCWIEDEASGQIMSGDSTPPISEDFE